MLSGDRFMSAILDLQDVVLPAIVRVLGPEIEMRSADWNILMAVFFGEFAVIVHHVVLLT